MNIYTDEKMFNVADYVVVPEKIPETVTGKVKKAKKPQKKPYADTELEELKKTARAYCRSAEEWALIRKKKKAALEAWIENHKFTRDKQIRDSCVGFGVKAYGLFLDKITGGGGRVHDQICNDLSLADSLSEMAHPFLKHMTCAVKALILSGHDVMEGKRIQKLEAPPVVIVEQNDNDDDDGVYTETGETGDESTTDGGGDAVLPMQGEQGMRETDKKEEEASRDVPVCD
jgi:hypothetical protein